MRDVLKLPAARGVILGGALFVSGLLADRVTADERALPVTDAPALQPVPAVDANHCVERHCDEGPCALPLPLSAKGQTLTLVSAEIDAQAEHPHLMEVEKGSSSRRARRAAIDELPTQHLSPQQRQAVEEVLDSLHVYRRLPAFRCELDPRVYEYFTQHPDVAVSIWRAMAISRLQMTERNPYQYDIDTQDGTTGLVTALYQTRENCLVHCEGLFKSPYLANAIHAKSLIHLKTSYANDQEGRVYITQQADLFVSFPSQKVGTIAKLISPVSNAIIDRNFEEISLFTYVMWQAMTKQPGWVEQIARRLDGVQPTRKDELIKLTADVYVTAQNDLRRRNGIPVSLENVQPPDRQPPRTTAAPPIDVTR